MKHGVGAGGFFKITEKREDDESMSVKVIQPYIERSSIKTRT